jgi:GDP-mannose 6-dehydrogenase
MKISLFGLGHVGTVCAACLADDGHTVIGVDKAPAKVDLIRAGRSPIVEPDLDDLVRKAVAAGRLTATMDAAEAIGASDLSLICVGTPSQPNGTVDLDAIEAVTAEIGLALRARTERHIVVVRSTVLPGTTRQIVVPRLAETSGKMPGHGFGIAYNPEFLREGSAVDDFRNPSKTVVGALDGTTADRVMSLYAGLPGVRISTEIETAELAKYVDNCWHALKVTFGNEIRLIAKALGIDSQEIMRIFFADERLNFSAAYLRPGFAFGGPCLPKDLRALTHLARQLDLDLPVLGHILESNRMLIERGVAWVLERGSRRVAVLGISFKPGTDEVRESPFLELVERLISKGCEVRIFDTNVNPLHLIGANRDHLLRTLPQIDKLMVPSISDATRWAETIVVTASHPAYAAAAAQARPNQNVLNLAHLERSDGQRVQAEGFLW